MAGQDWITINAADVTFDLNGFAPIGAPGSPDGVGMPSAAGKPTGRSFWRTSNEQIRQV